MANFPNRVHAEDELLVDMAGGEDAGMEEARRIGDLAKEFGVSLRTLRFYEDKGLLTPERVGSTRLYRHRDVARLKLILLGRKVGFSLREVKQIMDLYDPHGTNIRQMKTLLDRSNRQLGRLQKQRAELDAAIETLGEVIGTAKEKLAALPSGKPN
jgi:DNA-binding transcriptional MerR regulator